MRRSALVLLPLVAALLAIITRAHAAEVDLRQVCPDLRAEEVFRKEPKYGLSGELIGRVTGFTEFRRSAALVVGVGAYDKIRPTLEAPAVDAERMRKFLIDGAGFDYVVTLKDGRASLGLIRCLMVTAFPSLLGSNDRFLFYFSGHGDQRQVSGRVIGYLPLKNSSPGAYDTMIDMDDVDRWSGLLADTRHTLFILDACFSGLAGSQNKSLDEITEKRLELLKLPSHYLITAGAARQQSVASLGRWGGSLFTTALLEAASGKSGPGAEDGVVSLKEVLKHIEDRIAQARARYPKDKIEMSPQMSRLGPNEGEFFFLTPKRVNEQAGKPAEAELARGEPVQAKGGTGASAARESDERAFWASAERRDTPAAYRA